MNVEAGVTESDDPAGSDQTLVARVLAGDREAFAEMYRTFRPDVYRFAAHMTGSGPAADDIVQDVFLAVIRDIQRFDPARGGLLGWLLGVARNHVRRWQQRRRWLALTSSEHNLPSPNQVDPATTLARQQDEAALTRALAQVPARFREVITLCDLQELPYEVAAEVLKVPVGTVRSRLHRGRARLARTLGLSAPATAGRASVARVL